MNVCIKEVQKLRSLCQQGLFFFLIPEDNINKFKYFTMGFLIKIYIILGSHKTTLSLSLENFHLCRLLMSINKDIKKKKLFVEHFDI